MKSGKSRWWATRYGQEAIEILLQAMENQRDDLESVAAALPRVMSALPPAVIARSRTGPTVTLGSAVHKVK